MDCWYLVELSLRGGSNEHAQIMFGTKNRKISQIITDIPRAMKESSMLHRYVDLMIKRSACDIFKTGMLSIAGYPSIAKFSNLFFLTLTVFQNINTSKRYTTKRHIECLLDLG